MRRDRGARFAIGCVVAAVVLVIDQSTKTVAISYLSGQGRVPIAGDLFGLQLAFNPGAALSLGESQTGVITALNVVVIAALCVAVARARTVWWATGLGFVLGGALGNVVDRLFAPPSFGRGHVTDFLAYGDLFIGNLADVALGIGAAVLVVALLRDRTTIVPATADHANIPSPTGES